MVRIMDNKLITGNHDFSIRQLRAFASLLLPCQAKKKLNKRKMSLLKRITTVFDRRQLRNPRLFVPLAARDYCKPGGASKGTEGPPFPVHEGYIKLKQKQAEYSRQDGKPIWQKRPTDLMVFGLTWFGLAVGVYMQFEMIYKMSMPKR